MRATKFFTAIPAGITLIVLIWETETSYTVPNLENDRTYYFALIAYNSSGRESAYSAEVVYYPPPPPPLPPCSVYISPTYASFSDSGGSGTVSVTTPASCLWTAVSNASWVLITSNSSASGPAAVNISVLANIETSPRTGTLTIAGQVFTIIQSGAPSTFSISPLAQTFASTGGTGRVSITAPPEYSWSAYTQNSWITLNSAITGTGTSFIDYSISVNSGTSSRTGSIITAEKTLTVTQSGSPQGRVVFAVNSGGDEYVDKNGVVYQSDKYYLGGWSGSTAADISETGDVPLHQTERYGNFSYAIPLVNGKYQVTLKFNEFYWSAPGQRIFDVWLEGTQVLTNFDIFASVGKNRPYDVSFPVSVTDGQLDIDFRATVDYAKVSAITVMERPSLVILAINCGGPEYIDKAGVMYQADQYYDGGWPGTLLESISGTDDVPLYQTETITGTSPIPFLWPTETTGYR